MHGIEKLLNLLRAAAFDGINANEGQKILQIAVQVGARKQALRRKFSYS